MVKSVHGRDTFSLLIGYTIRWKNTNDVKNVKVSEDAKKVLIIRRSNCNAGVTKLTFDMGLFASRLILSTYKYGRHKPTTIQQLNITLNSSLDQKMPASNCTCKIEHVCAALTPTHTLQTVHHHHHYHHYDEREGGREAPSPRAIKIYANHLAPPITTSFFHKQTVNIFDNDKILDTSSGTLETLTWRTDVYKYVTRARPDDPNFKQNGGEIYIIMAHEGTCLMGRFLMTPAYLKTVKVPSSIMPVRQFPASNSGIQSGDDWSYNIDYTNTMPMFNQGGNNVFDFEASYKEDFVRSKCKQTGEETPDGLVFGVVEPRALSINYPIKGLSVFKCLDPTIFPVKITFEASVRDVENYVLGSISKEVTIPFDFLPVL